ncbi:MAG: hypothetical protein ACTH0V_05070 [Microbacteriaceae bacterium]
MIRLFKTVFVRCADVQAARDRALAREQPRLRELHAPAEEFAHDIAIARLQQAGMLGGSVLNESTRNLAPATRCAAEHLAFRAVPANPVIVPVVDDEVSDVEVRVVHIPIEGQVFSHLAILPPEARCSIGAQELVGPYVAFVSPPSHDDDGQPILTVRLHYPAVGAPLGGYLVAYAFGDSQEGSN